MRLDSFRSFAVAFYVTVAATLTFPLMITLNLLREEAPSNRVAAWVGIVATVLGTLGALWLVVLPLLHYNQAAGYYVHVFGLLPLVMLWAADALVRFWALRLATLACGFALLRYTYALNLADAALAVALVLLAEGLRGRWRIVQWLAVAGLGAAAFFIIAQLRPIFQVWGGMQRFDVDRVLKADLLVVVGATAYLLAGTCKGLSFEWLRSPLSRALRFPLAFAIASSVLVVILRKGKGVQYYYVTKYQMWACILLSFALVIVISHLAQTLAQKSSLRRPRVWLCVLISAMLLATVPSIWGKTFIGYRTTLLERVRSHGPPYKYLHALADVEAMARIKTILAKEHKTFGGYLTAFFPMFSFMNASFGYHTGRQEFFPPVTAPGLCVFWVAKERDTYRLGPADKLDALRSRVALPGSACSEYPAPWKSTPQSLCHRCY